MKGTVMIRKSIVFVATVIAFSGWSYAPVTAQSPQELLNRLIQQQMQEQEQSHNNEMMRFEFERQELQQRLQERDRD
jgi:predicted PurR-regulated permease PerM